MKFGIFYELSVPRPWTHESERTVYENALEQVRLADELGFDQVWCVEHHFLEEYSPLLRAGAVPDGVRDADEEHPRRPRHRRLRAAVQPPRSASPSARPCSTSSRAAGSSSAPAAARRGRSWPASRRDPDDDEEDLGRDRALPAEDVDAGALQLPGRGILDAVARDPAEALPEAAPADVGGRHVARHRARRRRPRHGQPRPDLRRLRRAGEEDRRVPPPHQGAATPSAAS